MKRPIRYGGAYDAPGFKPDYKKLKTAVGRSFPMRSQKLIQAAIDGFLTAQREPALSVGSLEYGLRQIKKVFLKTADTMEKLPDLGGGPLLPIWAYLRNEAKRADKPGLSEVDALFQIDRTTLLSALRSMAELTKKVNVPHPDIGRPKLKAEDDFIRNLYEAYKGADGTEPPYKTSFKNHEITGPFVSMVQELVRQMKENDGERTVYSNWTAMKPAERKKAIDSGMTIFPHEGRGYETGGLFETNIGRRVKEVLSKN